MSFIRDTLIVFRRELRLSLRNPAWMVIVLVQPVLYLVLFGPLLTKLPAETLGGAAGSGSAGSAEALPSLLRVLDDAGITLHSINLSRPTLDDVFLTMTGRSLRDYSPSAAASGQPEPTAPQATPAGKE